MNRSKRQFLELLTLVPFAVAGGPASAVAAACHDPAALTLNMRNRRKSLGYVEPSSDAKRRCALCAFYKAGGAQCGTCQLMVGAPVAETGVCRSFAAKTA